MPCTDPPLTHTHGQTWWWHTQVEAKQPPTEKTCRSACKPDCYQINKYVVRPRKHIHTGEVITQEREHFLCGFVWKCAIFSRENYHMKSVTESFLRKHIQFHFSCLMMSFVSSIHSSIKWCIFQWRHPSPPEHNAFLLPPQAAWDMRSLSETPGTAPSRTIRGERGMSWFRTLTELTCHFQPQVTPKCLGSPS